MTEPGKATHRAGASQALPSAQRVIRERSPRQVRPAQPGPDVDRLARWARGHTVMLTAVGMIVAQVIWKAVLLHGLYFIWDDFHNLDLAIEHPLSWSYLTYIWDGHLTIGLRMVAWLLARTSLYNWGLASTVTLAFTAAAGLACYRALRTLFGDGPRILLPLLFYLLTPLTVPSFAWWSSAMESVPLQLAIFMAATSHVLYIRTSRPRHLVAAAFWVAFGLIFFEKALVLPLLLFALTAGFLVSRRSLVDGARKALIHFWRAWAVYLGLMIVYAGVLVNALHSSIAQPHVAMSVGSNAAFIGDLLKDSFLPGAFGGPWQWYPAGAFVISGPPIFLSWLAVVGAVTVVVVSITTRRTALFAWLMLAGWIFVADMVTLLVGRVSATLPGLLGLDIRYVADAAPVTALCIGLAFWPVLGAPSPVRRRASQAQPKTKHQLRMAAGGLIGVFVLGSFWSVQHLGAAVSGAAAKSFISNATEAVQQTQPRTVIYDQAVPATIEPAMFAKYAQDSAVIGDLAIGEFDWITKPDGTIDNLQRFGADGKLYNAWVGPTTSVLRPAQSRCWPKRHRRIVIRFARATPIYTRILRFGYLLGATHSVVVTVGYGHSTKVLTVLPGLHSAFLPISGGNVTEIVISGLGAAPMCVGDAEAGNIISNPFTKPIP